MKASSTPSKRKSTPPESDVTALNVDRDVIRHPSADLGRIRGQAQSRVGEVVRLDLAGTIMAGLELGDTAGVDIEADDRRTLPRKGDGDRQTDIAEPDDGELSTVRHE